MFSFMNDKRYAPASQRRENALGDANELRQELKQLTKQTTFTLPKELAMRKQIGMEFQDPNNSDIKYLHGTTTLAFIFNEGIIVAVDSRASMGSYIGSQSVEKVIKINPYLLGTIAGGAADCQYWQRRLSLQCKLYELREGKRISVAAASKLMGNVVYQYRSHGLSMGMMAAGIDEGSGPQLFYLDSDGSRLKGQRFSVGSGSTFAYGILDNLWRADLTVEEACEVGRRSIYHATRRDAYSGGMINVFYVGPDGWRCVSRDDMDTLHYEKYELEKK